MANSYSKILTERIRQIMSIRNISNAELAKRSGLSPSTLDNLLNNHTKNPNIGILNLIAHGLQIKLSVLLEIKEIDELSFEERKEMAKRKPRNT